MTEVVFIVEEFDQDGEIITLSDKFYLNFPDFDQRSNFSSYFKWVKKAYKTNTGKRIKYQRYNSIENFNPNTKYFYFIPIAQWMNDFHIWFYLFSAEKIKRLSKHKVNILFAYDQEQLPAFDITFFIKSFEWFYTLALDRQATGLNFYFLTASEVKSDLNTFIKGYFHNTIGLYYSPMILLSAWNSTPDLGTIENASGVSKSLSETVLNDYYNSPKTKQFLSLNRFPRFHRETFLHGLRSSRLLDEGYVSRNLSGEPYGLSEKYTGNYADQIRNDMLIPLEIMNLDVTSLTHAFDMGYGLFPMEHLKNSCYDIVNETGTKYQVDDVVELSILTEKVAKSLAFGRPFMINGGPDCLALLKKLGFETYDFLFDESYDQIDNLIDRQEAMIRNIMSYRGRLNELWDKIQAHKDVLDRNRNKFFNFDFEDYFIREIANAKD